MKKENYFLISQPKHMLWVLKRLSQWDSSSGHQKHMLNIMGKKIFTILHWQFLFIFGRRTYCNNRCPSLAGDLLPFFPAFVILSHFFSDHFLLSFLLLFSFLLVSFPVNINKSDYTRFIQASLCKIQGLFKDFWKTFLLFSKTKNLWKILIYTLKFYFRNLKILVLEN